MARALHCLPMPAVCSASRQAGNCSSANARSPFQTGLSSCNEAAGSVLDELSRGSCHASLPASREPGYSHSDSCPSGQDAPSGSSKTMSGPGLAASPIRHTKEEHHCNKQLARQPRAPKEPALANSVCSTCLGHIGTMLSPFRRGPKWNLWNRPPQTPVSVESPQTPPRELLSRRESVEPPQAPSADLQHHALGHC